MADAKGGQRSLWLAGNPGSGKTFLGDYLASRGWHHIDGDQGNQTEDAGVKERWGKLYHAMTEHQAGKTEISEELWRPYYHFLVQEYNKALESGRNVADFYKCCMHGMYRVRWYSPPYITHVYRYYH